MTAAVNATPRETTTRERLDELLFLLGGGVHPPAAAKRTGFASLAAAARRARVIGDVPLARALDRAHVREAAWSR